MLNVFRTFFIQKKKHFLFLQFKPLLLCVEEKKEGRGVLFQCNPPFPMSRQGVLVRYREIDLARAGNSAQPISWQSIHCFLFTTIYTIYSI